MNEYRVVLPFGLYTAEDREAFLEGLVNVEESIANGKFFVTFPSAASRMGEVDITMIAGIVKEFSLDSTHPEVNFSELYAKIEWLDTPCGKTVKQFLTESSDELVITLCAIGHMEPLRDVDFISLEVNYPLPKSL